jgi:hypothetical protein
VNSCSHLRVALLCTALALAACAVPLGPGFQIERQEFELRFATGTAPRVVVGGRYRVRNAGNRALHELEIALPAAPALVREQLRIRLDGAEIPPRASSDVAARTIRLPFAPPWAERERRALEFEYTLAPGDNSGGADFAAAADAFHIRPYRCCPALLPPERLFALSGERPRRIRYSVFVPEDFRVLAAGRSRGVRRRGGVAEHRFEIREGDADAYVVAGRYHELKFSGAGGEVTFWTLEPLDSAAAQRAAQRLSATLSVYREAFGALARRAQPVWIVETRARLASAAPGDGQPERYAGAAFPRGALLNRAAFALGAASETFQELAEHELAHTWFGEALASRSDAELLLSEALAEYAVFTAAVAREGESARRRRAARLLRWYDEAAQHGPEKPLAQMGASDAWELRRFAYSKGALFFVALEDEVGKSALHRALARMVAALTGDRDPAGEGRAGFAELRSAVEFESGRNLAGFFRAWLFSTGVPDAVRQRYAVAAEPAR